jgi:hypothetical protein
MQAVYEAENSIDAHLAKAWLEQAGLSPWIRGEFLAGALGELPAHGVLAVCVPTHEVAAAHEALEALRRVRSGEDVPSLEEDHRGVDPDEDDDAWVRA